MVLSLLLQLFVAEASFFALLSFSFLEVTLLLPDAADADLWLAPFTGVGVLYSAAFFFWVPATLLPFLINLLYVSLPDCLLLLYISK